MTFSTETKDIFAALALAQASIEGAVKDKVNPAFKSKYADLSSVIDAARGPLKANGLALTIGLVGDESGVALEALLAHSSGQWIKYAPFPVMVTKKDAQGQGSAITYGRRYLTMSILGIPAEDDDGNVAVQPKRTEAPAPKAPEPSKPQSSPRSKVLMNYLTSIKPKLTEAQIKELSVAVGNLSITEAAIRENAAGMIALNGAADAFAGAGFEVVE